MRQPVDLHLHGNFRLRVESPQDRKELHAVGEVQNIAVQGAADSRGFYRVQGVIETGIKPRSSTDTALQAHHSFQPAINRDCHAEIFDAFMFRTRRLVSGSRAYDDDFARPRHPPRQLPSPDTERPAWL